MLFVVVGASSVSEASSEASEVKAVEVSSSEGREAEECRHVPFVTLSEVKPRVWLTLAGCNFKCRGCFSVAREVVGECLSVDDLMHLVRRAIRQYYGREHVEEGVITGGEPTLKRRFLVKLVSRLREIADWIVLDTNGYLLTPEYLEELLKAGLSEVMFDLKAYDEHIHVWYTGFSNKKVLENIEYASKKVKITVNTVLIPDIVGEEEVEKIAKFIAEISKESKEPIEFRINPFRAERSREKISRDPTEDEMLRAYEIACMHLNTVIGRSCVRERKVEEKRGWVTVFPDGTMRRRTLADYRRNVR